MTEANSNQSALKDVELGKGEDNLGTHESSKHSLHTNHYQMMPSNFQPIKIGNPAPLGLMSFGMTTLMLMYVEAEWVNPEFSQIVVCFGLFFGGATQLFVGMWELVKGNSFPATVFSSYGAFWLGWSILRVLKGNDYFTWGADIANYDRAESIFLAQWGIMSFLFFILSFKSAKILQFILIDVAVTFFLLSAGQNYHSAKVAGGYFGLFAAAGAIYLSIAILFHEIYGKKWYFA
mmetsp:Transcript_9277/g.13936  ORF Transcript_9277/g.13936 Transcript_9277/m.13936 type:complete len:234 (+) Transcript_9277:188-889(+)